MMWNSTGPDPQAAPPPGVVPDFDNPPDAGHMLNIAVTAACTAIVTIFFSIRLFTKCFIQHRFQLEDWTCAAAFACIIWFSATVFMMARYGSGYHAWNIRRDEYLHMLKWCYVNTVAYCPAAFFTKATILLLMARVFAVEHRVSQGIRIFIWALLLAYTPIQILKTVICIPVSTMWDPDIKHPRCLNLRKVFFSELALSMTTDLIILLIPIPLTWRLHMSFWKKMKIVSLLGAGGIATGLTIYRTYRTALFVDSNDVPYDYVLIGILTTLELTIGFVCACLPSVNVLAAKLFPSAIHHSSSGTPSNRRRGGTTSTLWGSISKITQLTGRKQSVAYPTAEPRAPSPVLNIDVELDRIFGRPRDGEMIERCQPITWQLNSDVGRREGWLSTGKGTNGELQDAEFIRKAVERSKLLSLEGPPDSWCPVWDGPRQPIRG